MLLAQLAQQYSWWKSTRPISIERCANSKQTVNDRCDARGDKSDATVTDQGADFLQVPVHPEQKLTGSVTVTRRWI